MVYIEREAGKLQVNASNLQGFTKQLFLSVDSCLLGRCIRSDAFGFQVVPSGLVEAGLWKNIPKALCLHRSDMATSHGSKPPSLVQVNLFRVDELQVV